MKDAVKLRKTMRSGQDSGLSLHMFGKQSLTRNILTAVTVFAASFSFAFLCGSLTFIENETSASEEGYGDGTGGTIAFSIDKPTLKGTRAVNLWQQVR